jgi:hypothetical protein
VAKIHPYFSLAGINEIIILEDARSIADERGRFFYVQEWEGETFPERWRLFVPVGIKPLARYDKINLEAMTFITDALRRKNLGETVDFENLLAEQPKSPE